MEADCVCLYRSLIYVTTLSPEKTVTDCCALLKLLLVVFFHPRALPQSNYSTDTGSSRASPNCPSV